MVKSADYISGLTESLPPVATSLVYLLGWVCMSQSVFKNKTAQHSKKSDVSSTILPALLTKHKK